MGDSFWWLLLILIFIGTLLTVFIISYLSRKNWVDSEWSGTVIDKNSSMSGYAIEGIASLNQNCVLKVKMDNGSTKNVAVSQGIYEKFNIGDKITKHKDDSTPV